MDTSTKSALHAALSALETARAAISAALTQPEHTGSSLLDAKQSLAEYGIGRDGLLAASGRGELELHRGARQRILVERAELERWIRSRPVAPRKRVESIQDLDSWERDAAAELRAIGGAK